MQIQDIARWQWIALGILLGVTFGYLWTSNGTDLEGIRQAQPYEFERDLLLTDETSGQPFVRSVIVRPTEQAFNGPVNVVIYQRLGKDKQNHYGWIEKRLIARVPYVPAIRGRVADEPQMNVVNYLQQLSKENPGVKFHYGWWLETRNAMLLGAAGGALLIGGVWPSLLGLIVGAGLGGAAPREPKTQSRRDWGSLFRRSKPTPRNAAAARAGDPSAVSDVADAYEQKLAAGAAPRTAAAVAAGSAGTPGAQGASAVRRLDAGPAEPQAPAAKPAEEDDVEVKGEYYPVLFHHKKDHAPDEGAPGKH